MARLLAKSSARASALAGTVRRGLSVKGIAVAGAVGAGSAIAVGTMLASATPAAAATTATLTAQTVHVSHASPSATKADRSGAAIKGQSAVAAPAWVTAFQDVRSGVGAHEAANLAHQKAAAAKAAAAKTAAAKAAAAQKSGDPRAIAQSMLSQYGWSAGQFSYLNQLWFKESGWSLTATNPSSGAYGIPQSLPASQMASAGPDYMTNPATQIKWGLTYIKDRYGSPSGAWAHEVSNNWY